jgi:hypothetical protein
MSFTIVKRVDDWMRDIVMLYKGLDLLRKFVVIIPAGFGLYTYTGNLVQEPRTQLKEEELNFLNAMRKLRPAYAKTMNLMSTNDPSYKRQSIEHEYHLNNTISKVASIETNLRRFQFERKNWSLLVKFDKLIAEKNWWLLLKLDELTAGKHWLNFFMVDELMLEVVELNNELQLAKLLNEAELLFENNAHYDCLIRCLQLVEVLAKYLAEPEKGGLNIDEYIKKAKEKCMNTDTDEPQKKLQELKDKLLEMEISIGKATEQEYNLYTKLIIEVYNLISVCYRTAFKLELSKGILELLMTEDLLSASSRNHDTVPLINYVITQSDRVLMHKVSKVTGEPELNLEDLCSISHTALLGAEEIIAQDPNNHQALNALGWANYNMQDLLHRIKNDEQVNKAACIELLIPTCTDNNHNDLKTIGASINNVLLNSSNYNFYTPVNSCFMNALLGLEESSPRITCNNGRLNSLIGNTENSINIFSEAFQLQPNNPLLAYLLAREYGKADKFRESKKYYTIALVGLLLIVKKCKTDANNITREVSGKKKHYRFRIDYLEYLIKKVVKKLKACDDHLINTSPPKPTPFCTSCT